MFRIRAANGDLRQSRFLRFSSTTSYVLFSAAGFALLSSPNLGVVHGLTGQVMAGFLAVGGLLCAFGTASMRWVGEFVGLPLVVTALAVLGFKVWYDNVANEPLIAVGNLLLLLAIAGIMVTRWRMVLAIYWVVYHLAREKGRG